MVLSFSCASDILLVMLSAFIGSSRYFPLMRLVAANTLDLDLNVKRSRT